MTDESEVLPQGQEEVENTAVEEQHEQEEKPVQSRSQNAKQRLRRKLAEEERRNAELAKRLEAEQARLDALESKLESVINPPAPRPQRVDFETEEDYEDSLLDWKLSQNKPEQKPVEAPQAEVTPVETEQKQDFQVPDELYQNWQNQLDDASEKYDDFEEKLVSIPQESMTDAMTFAIMESPKAGDVAYFLGSNLNEAARIAKLPIPAQVREIDKLTAKFKQDTTNAPDPINPITGKGDVVAESTDPLLDGVTFT